MKAKCQVEVEMVGVRVDELSWSRRMILDWISPQHHSVSAPRSRQRMQDLKDRNRGPRLEPGISRALPVSLFILNQKNLHIV